MSDVSFDSRAARRERADALVAEGDRYGLAPEVSRQIADRVCQDATDRYGRFDLDHARSRFHAIAARAMRLGGRLQRDPGKGPAIGDTHEDAADAFGELPPGKGPTLVEAEQRRIATQRPRAEPSANAGLPGEDFINALLGGERGNASKDGDSSTGSGPSSEKSASSGAADVAGRSEDPMAIAERGTAGPGGALPHAEAIQASFGRHDISGVRAHVGGDAAVASDQLDANGFAIGDKVGFASAPDLHTAAHEAAHTVQQQNGVQLQSNIDQGSGDPLEQHADAVADAVVAGQSAEPLLDAKPSAAGSGGRAVQRDSKAPPSVAAAPAAPVPIAAEDAILAMLNRRVDSRDVRALQLRVRDLTQSFAALSTPDRRAVRSRLIERRADDKLATAFQHRLATPTRERLIRTLDGEPTPMPAPHESIEPDAFVAGLDDATIRTSPDRPMLAGYEATLVTAQIASTLSPAENHVTEVAWRVTDEGAIEGQSRKMLWPAKQPGPLELEPLELLGGRSTLTVEIIVDGMVRRILRKMIEVGPNAMAGAHDLPKEVRAQVRNAFAKPIRADKRGQPDEAQVDEMLSELAAIVPAYRAEVVAQLSAPPKGADSLAALFLANIPATVRPRVIETLTRGRIDEAPGGVDANITGVPFELDVSPRPLVIAPWMKDDATLKVLPTNPHAAAVDDPSRDGPEIEVFWRIEGEAYEFEQLTRWKPGDPRGEPLQWKPPGGGTYRITAHFSQGGIVGQTIATEATVVMEEKSDRAAADQMAPAQLVEERARIREQLTTAPAGQAADELWIRAAALDANLAATGAEEPAPKVPDDKVFAPDSWINHTGPGVNQPLSTDRVHIRYLLEQRYRLADMSAEPTLVDALRAYINDAKTEPENRARAQTILELVRAEQAAMDREFSGFQDAFGKKGLELCRQLLGQTQRDVRAKQREYGFSTGADSDAVRDNVEELALAARELLPLQEAITAQEQKVADLERQMNEAQEQANDPAVDDDTKVAAIERAEALRQVLMVEQDGIADAERTFGTRKGELSGEFPVLSIANVGGPDKQRMDANILRQIAQGKLGEIAAKLDKTLTDIDSVNGAIDEGSVWAVPQLLALTKQALGVTPRTFQDRAVEAKLLEIKTGKIINVVSKVTAAILATILSFGAAGPMVFALDAGMLAQDAFDLAKSIKEYRFEQALAGTHYDKAKALSQDEPSTFWLAFEIVTTLIGVADVATAAKGLAQARKVFSEIRAARKTATAVDKAEHVAGKLDEIANLAGSRGLSGEVQQRLRREALEEMAQRADEVGETARAMLRESDDFATKAADLAEAVRQHATTLGNGKTAADFKLAVLSKAEFEARFGSKKGRAVFTLNDGKATIFARFDARPADIADEAAHLVQLSDPKLASDLKYLDEANLADWKQMSVSDKLEFYQRKLNVEIDAKERTLAKLTDPNERELVQHNLDDLKALQADVASITPDQLRQMNAGTLKEPAFLDQPARAFGKTKVPVNGTAPARPDLAQVDPNAPAPRAVASDKNHADYSTAYGDKTVSSVQQHGDVWQERVIVTSGYAGKVKRIDPGKNGSTVISIHTDSGGVHKYVIEAGAEIPDNIKKAKAAGERIDKDAVLGREVPRDYRWVEVQYSDGKPPTTRAEIKREGGGWIQRGNESGERGRAAETAAMKEADEGIEAAKKAGEISGAVHLPHRVGGGGFDDVIVEFVGTGENVTARIRIREVKDYPNRHVPLDEFSALNENWAQNLEKLSNDVDKALRGDPPHGYEKLDADQLDAIKRKLDANDFEVEIRLGDTTKLGDPGKSHAATTLPALEKHVGKKINVKKIGEGDR